MTQTAEQVLITGDLARLTPEQRMTYYMRTCESLGLNPLTRPFEYITLNSKLTLYARKDATDQLRKLHSISIEKPDIRIEDDWIIVTVVAHDASGRTDSDIGVVNKKDMRGDFGNALMKAVTKAKRRVTLSICGLGMLDETEIETIPDARPVTIDDNGTIRPEPPAAQSPQSQPEVRPYPPEVVRAKVEAGARRAEERGTPPKDTTRNMIVVNLEACFGDKNAEEKRRTVLAYLTGHASVNDLSDWQVIAISRWLNAQPDSGGQWLPDPMAAREAQAIYAAALSAEGQQTLL